MKKQITLHKMAKILLLLNFTFLTSMCFGQNYKAQFDNLCQSGDTLNQKILLTKWESEDPTNPELFTSYLNYCIQKSELVDLVMQPVQKNRESISQNNDLQIEGNKVTEPVNYQMIIKKGIDKIDIGIKKYPNRLDMRFDKIYALSLINDWDSFTNEIVKAIQYSQRNKNKWTWTYNVKKENSKDFFLSSIQDYERNLLQTEDKTLFKNIRTIATEILTIYPNHIESLTNISLTYVLSGDYDKGIETLLQAEKIESNNKNILMSIALGYRLKGDKSNSLIYFEKMLKLDDQNSVDFAKQQINLLKNE